MERHCEGGQRVPKERISRKLTAGEIFLVQEVFKSSVNTSLVRVINKKFIPFQPKNTGITPNGKIYAAGVYRDDFSKQAQIYTSWFIHEMTHVWQKQNRVLNPMWRAIGARFRHPFNYDKNYWYKLDANKDLLKYKVEQQAQIVQDYFQIFHQHRGPSDNMKNVVGDAERDKLFKAVLGRFLADPSYPATAARDMSSTEHELLGDEYAGRAS